MITTTIPIECVLRFVRITIARCVPLVTRRPLYVLSQTGWRAPTWDSRIPNGRVRTDCATTSIIVSSYLKGGVSTMPHIVRSVLHTIASGAAT